MFANVKQEVTVARKVLPHPKAARGIC
jgi:hypothetical protein